MALRVVVWGLGAMGSGMARLVAARAGMALVGGIAGRAEKEGRDLGEVCGLEDLGVTVSRDAEKVLSRTRPEVVLLATGSGLLEVMPQIEVAVRHEANVITIAEELAYPWAVSLDLTAHLDEMARSRGVTVLGTGVNPGFVLDTLIIALTGVCADVRAIRATRINDLSPYGPTVIRGQGVGLSPEGFRRGVEAGSVMGHVGFPQSIGMIARALGWRLDTVRESKEPIVSSTRRETPYVRVEPGQVAGCRHVAVGVVGGREAIVLEHPQQVCPQEEGVQTGDFIRIEGTPCLDMAIQPEIPGGTATVAIAVNMIPAVVDAAPGLVCMADLPVPRAVLG